MVNAITSGATSYASSNMQAAPIQQTGSTNSSQGSARSTTTAADTVQLSASAQAHAMQQQGMNVKTIAANMGVSTQDVDSYLGISSSATGGGGSGSQTLQSVASKVTVHGPQTYLHGSAS